jgi:hypothetical protein
MPTNRYYGDDIATFRVEIDGTELTAGKVRNVSIMGEASHNELFTTDQVTREDVKRREVAVTVEMTIVEFNEDLAKYWLDGSGSAQSTTVVDDSNVAEYTITLEQNMTDHTDSSGDESLKAVVDNVHFEEMPLIDLAEGEYNEHDLSGRGDGVELTNESVV